MHVDILSSTSIQRVDASGWCDINHILGVRVLPLRPLLDPLDEGPVSIANPDEGELGM